MAHYKYLHFLSQDAGTQYDETHRPADIVPYSGVYRCTGCGKSVTAIKDKRFPPQNHHAHPTGAPIRWQLTVMSHWVGGA